MKNIITITALMLAVSPVRAQYWDLDTVSIKDVQAVSIPQMKEAPIPAAQEQGIDKDYSQGSKWFNYVMPNPGVNDGSSAVMDFTVDNYSYMNFESHSFGKLYVRFYTPADPMNPAKVYISFNPGDTGMNYDVPKVVKKALTFGKDQYGNYHYYADISKEIHGARLEANGQVFSQELTVTKHMPEGGNVTYKIAAVKLFDAVK